MTQSITDIDANEIKHVELDYPRAIMQIRAESFEAGRRAERAYVIELLEADTQKTRRFATGVDIPTWGSGFETALAIVREGK